MLIGIMLSGVFSISASATECSDIDNSTVLQKWHRAYTVLEVLRTKALNADKLPISICISGVKDSASVSRFLACCYPYQEPVILITRHALQHFSDIALSGGLAHELAHILRNKPQRNVYDEEAEQMEQATDATAIELVGEEALHVFYVAHTRNVAWANERVELALKHLRRASSTRRTAP